MLHEIVERRGGAFSAFVAAKAAAAGQSDLAADMLRSKFGEDSRATQFARGAVEIAALSEHERQELISKAAVVAATGLSGNWSAALSAYMEGLGEFYEVARHFEIPAAMDSISRVAFHQRLFTSATGATAAWVKSGAPAPIASGVFTASSLNPLKIVSTIVATKEVTSLGDPAALNSFRTMLITAAANAVNAAFIDQTNDGVSEEKPASITYGVDAETATDNPRADIKNVLESHPNSQTTFVIGHPALFAGLCSSEFPAIGARGGELAGLPAIASSACPSSDLVFVDASGVALARGDVEITVSAEGSAVMDDGPSGAAANVSFFQIGAVGVQLSQYINWTKMRAGCVSIIEECDYGSEGSA